MPHDEQQPPSTPDRSDLDRLDQSDRLDRLDRLRRLLGGTDTAWLIERVRARIAQGRPLDGTVTLTDATPQQRRALESVLGRVPAAGRSLSIRLPELDALLRETGVCPEGLAGAVLALTGPVQDRQAEAESAQRAWQHAHRPLRELAARRPELQAWSVEAERSGVVKRLCRGDAAVARQLTVDAASIIALLPADGIALPVLAAQILGDAHALDGGRALTTLVLSAVRALGGLPATATASAEARRRAWASVGIALDELSSRVLTLGLVAELPGEPAVLTLRRVRRNPPELPGGTVYVCENPAVVAAAAEELGSRCPPLVCVEGQPSAAARALLAQLVPQLVARGGRLAYHGDFDWGGIRIATGVLALPRAAPWRYDAESYLAAIARGAGGPLANGTPLDTPWDPPLRAAVERHRVRVEEEYLIPDLLADLAHAP
jgi:uncharacterized protein (TIGR02679 family)